MTNTGRSRIFDRGVRVYGPRRLRKDGSWSKQTQVVAVFLRPIDAARYLRQCSGEGFPAFVSNEDHARVARAEQEAAAS